MLRIFFFFSLLSIMHVHWYKDSFDLIIRKKKKEIYHHVQEGKETETHMTLKLHDFIIILILIEH